jgi:hypothetical protein
MVAVSEPIADFSGYVDNPTSTPYRPRDTVVHAEGERYAPPSRIRVHGQNNMNTFML